MAHKGPARYIFDLYFERQKRFFFGEVYDESFNSGLRQLVGRLYGRSSQISGYLEAVSALVKVEITSAEGSSMGYVYVNCCFEHFDNSDDLTIIKRLPFLSDKLLATPQESIPLRQLFQVLVKANAKTHFGKELQLLHDFMREWLDEYPGNMTFLERPKPIVSPDSFTKIIAAAKAVKKLEWREFRYKPMLNKCRQVMVEAAANRYAPGYHLRQVGIFTGELLLLLEKLGKHPQEFMFTGEDGKSFGITVSKSKVLVDAEILTTMLTEAKPLLGDGA